MQPVRLDGTTVDLAPPVLDKGLGPIKGARVIRDDHGVTWSAWEPSWRELLGLLAGRYLWVGVIKDGDSVLMTVSVGFEPEPDQGGR